MKNRNPLRSFASLASAAFAIAMLLAPSAQAAWVSYHDLGAINGNESTGNITTHQSGPSGASANALDTSTKDLIQFSDGADTGVDFSIAGANAMDSRTSVTGPPAGSTDADALFNVAGLNLNDGIIYEGGGSGSGATTFTFTGLDTGELYDIAFYGDRTAGADGVERFTLGGADAASNSSSAGTIVSTFVSDWETRPNAAAGNIVRWTNIDPGADGSFTITMDPEAGGNLSNVA